VSEVPVPDEPQSEKMMNIDLYEYSLDLRERLLECNKKLKTLKER